MEHCFQDYREEIKALEYFENRDYIGRKELTVEEFALMQRMCINGLLRYVFKIRGNQIYAMFVLTKLGRMFRDDIVNVKKEVV